MIGPDQDWVDEQRRLGKENKTVSPRVERASPFTSIEQQKAVDLARAVCNRDADNRQPVPLSQAETLLICRALLVLASSVELATGIGNDDPHDEAQLDALAFTGDSKHMTFLHDVLMSDEQGLIKAEASYGSSWKMRGGVGAFMMLARKWDRLEKRTAQHQYDIFAAIHDDTRREGVIDDVRDLRRYLTLVECEMASHGIVKVEVQTKDNAR
jgi:hypothetical protein